MHGMEPAKRSLALSNPSLISVSNSLVCCPFCGLLCDDLRVERDDGHARIEGPCCPRASRMFVVPNRGQAMIDGRPAGLAEAYRSAAAILAGSRRPLIGGLACDVGGHRAALAFAEKRGGVVDHMNGNAQFRNWLAFQDGGWITTTLSEVRNRADLIVLAGTVASRFPRFFERCLAAESQFGELRRRIIVLGDDLSSISPTQGQSIVSIPVQESCLGELFAVIRARANGHEQDAPTVAGLSMKQIDALLADMQAARYGVLVWNAAELDFPNSDMTIHAMVDLVKELNRTTRWSGLPLGGNDGDTSAAQSCTWQTGYPLRISFEPGGPHYEPLLFSADRLLGQEEVDALLWISAFDPTRTPPRANCPTVVLGRPDMTFDQAPDIFIPVAVPGVQHSGFLHRMDAVVALPLQAPVPSELHSVAQALAAIQEEMGCAEA